MYEHHKTSMENLVKHFESDPEVIAVILGGSVAKGKERVDSDIDAIIVVSPQRFEKLQAENRISECFSEGITYDGGYYDIKYCTEDYLKTLMERGSEPSRNAFMCARCLYTKNPEIAVWVEEIPVFQQSEKEEKLLSFFSGLTLHRDYFWKVAGDEIYLKTRTAVDIVLCGLRMVLQEREVLFQCQRKLIDAVSGLGGAYAETADKAKRLLSEMTDEALDDFVNAVMTVTDYQPPKDYSIMLSRFIDDNEQWWYKNRPVITEW